MDVKAFKEVGKVVAGQHIAAALYNDDPSGTPYLTGPADFGEERPIVTKWTSSPKIMASEMDVLVTVKGNGVGKSNLGSNAAIGRQLMALRPNPKLLDQKYLYRFIVASKSKINALGQDATVPGIGKDDIDALKIPLPPLSEQKRIAEILDRAEALRAKRRAALALLDELTQSIFLDMFGDPVTNSLGLDSVPLGELIKFKSGDFLPAKKMASDGKFPVLGGNGINGWHDEYLFEDSKVVVGRVGVYCGCVHISPPQSWITDNALYVAEQGSRLAFVYLVHALTHAKLNQYASQSGQPLISGSRIYPVHILLPPLKEQKDFAKRIAGVEDLKKVLVSSHSEFDQLFASLQHRAFRGEL